VTDTFTGSISTKKPKARFTVTSAAGDASSTLTFSGTGKVKSTPSLKLTVLDGTGAVVATVSGPSVLKGVVPLPAGASAWEVSGSTSVSFTLKVTHPAP
jgi:hypothetical protein